GLDRLGPPGGEQCRELELLRAVGLHRTTADDGVDQRVVATNRRDVHRSGITGIPGVGTAVPRSASRLPVAPTALAIPSHTFHLPSPLVGSVLRVPCAGQPELPPPYCPRQLRLPPLTNT